MYRYIVVFPVPIPGLPVSDCRMRKKNGVQPTAPETFQHPSSMPSLQPPTFSYKDISQMDTLYHTNELHLSISFYDSCKCSIHQLQSALCCRLSLSLYVSCLLIVMVMVDGGGEGISVYHDDRCCIVNVNNHRISRYPTSWMSACGQIQMKMAGRISNNLSH